MHTPTDLTFITAWVFLCAESEVLVLTDDGVGPGASHYVTSLTMT
jgi:sulfur transfer complex TusBCD TusB component (DsrH family)